MDEYLDKFLSSEEYENEFMKQYSDVFEKACQYLMNVILTQMETKPKKDFFENTLYKFISKYKQVFVKSSLLKTDTSSYLYNNSATTITWNSMLGAILLHAMFPLSEETDESVAKCLTCLNSAFLKEDDEKELKKEDEIPDDQAIEFSVAKKPGEPIIIIGATLYKLVCSC